MDRTRFLALAASIAALVASTTSVAAQTPFRPLQRSMPATELALALANAPAAAAPFASFAPSPAERLRLRHEYLAAVAEREDERWFVDVEAGGRANARRDFEGGGALRIQRLGWDAEIGRRIGDETSFTVGLRAEATFYDLTAAPDLGVASAKPFNDVYETAVGTTVSSALGRDTTWITGVDLIVAGEDETDLGDAAQVGFVTGARHRAGDDLAVTLGVDVRTRLEADPWIVPFLGVDWRLDDDWRVSFAGTRGRIERRLGREWTAFATARYELRQYRLNEDAPIASGVVRDEEIDAGLGLEWQPRAGVRFGVSAGTTLWQELSILESDGAKLGEDELDRGGWLALDLRLSF